MKFFFSMFWDVFLVLQNGDAYMKFGYGAEFYYEAAFVLFELKIKWHWLNVSQNIYMMHWKQEPVSADSTFTRLYIDTYTIAYG